MQIELTPATSLIPMTGDLVFTSGKHGIKLLIRFFSDPLGVWRGDYVPHHVGILRADDGDMYVYEATVDDGVERSKLAAWKEKHRKDRTRLVHMPFRGCREEISDAIVRAEGTPYETFFDFVKIAWGANKEDAKRAVCSTVIVRILVSAGKYRPMLMFKVGGLSSSNTTPHQLEEWARSIGGVVEVL